MEGHSEIHMQVLDFILESIEEQGYPPSVREICQKLHVKSTSTVHKYLNELEDSGFIQRENAKNRSIRVLRQGKNVQVIHVPMLGTVAAGLPILAAQQNGEYIAFETTKYSREELFALQIKGDSMIEAGILEGDYVVAQKTSSAENGEIVVALIGDEATVKTFYREDGHYRLQPENSRMEAIIVNEMSVLGRVVALIRYMA